MIESTHEAPLYYVISAVLVGWHKLFGSIFGPETGIAWVLSIIGLTLVIRLPISTGADL